MADFLDRRKDWQVRNILTNRNEGLISENEAQELIQLVEERYDNARRKRKGIG